MSTLIAEFTVVGTPVPQGSMRAFARKGGGRPIMTGDNIRTRPWKTEVTSAATHAMPEDGWPVRGPVAVSLRFRFARPTGHFGAKGLRPAAPRRPMVKPDVDKLVRAILDAIVDAQLIADDAQVAALVAWKYYCGPGEQPGVDVRVTAL